MKRSEMIKKISCCIYGNSDFVDIPSVHIQDLCKKILNTIEVEGMLPPPDKEYEMLGDENIEKYLIDKGLERGLHILYKSSSLWEREE